MKRGLGALLSVVLFLTNVLFAHAAEINLWSERKRIQLPPIPAPSLNFVSPRLKSALTKESENSLIPIIKALPQQTGTIRNVLLPKKFTGRTVIHVQDVHMNLEAQKNIGAAVEGVIANVPVSAVALEGAFDNLDFTWVRNYPNKDVTKAVADYFLKDNRISGPVHAAFVSANTIPAFIGVDDKEHYDANVQATRDAARLAPAAKENLSRVTRALAQEKTIYNPALKEFDARVEAYRAGSMAWGDYVRLLASQPSVEVSPKIEAFLAALELEDKSDFARIEMERAQLLNQLVAKLNPAETENVLHHSAAYRAGELSHSDFYGTLRTLCASKGISLRRYPAMDSYIQYVLLSDSLDVEAIIKETATLEKETYAALAKTEDEKRLVEKSRQVYLVGKLLDFALTKEEWNEYKAVPSSWFLVPGNSLNTFESFYREAEIRDQKMSENLLKFINSKLGTRNQELGTSVLVTGGFHSSGIDRRLLDAGYAVITYVPTITKVDDVNGSSYLSVFTQEKTPLDKLFTGEKLFLAKTPMAPLGPTQQVFGATGQIFELPEKGLQTVPTADGKLQVTADPNSKTVTDVEAGEPPVVNALGYYLKKWLSPEAGEDAAVRAGIRSMLLEGVVFTVVPLITFLMVNAGLLSISFAPAIVPNSSVDLTLPAFTAAALFVLSAFHAFPRWRILANHTRGSPRALPWYGIPFFLADATVQHFLIFLPYLLLPTYFAIGWFDGSLTAIGIALGIAMFAFVWHAKWDVRKFRSVVKSDRHLSFNRFWFWAQLGVILLVVLTRYGLFNYETAIHLQKSSFTVWVIIIGSLGFAIWKRHKKSQTLKGRWEKFDLEFDKFRLLYGKGGPEFLLNKPSVLSRIATDLAAPMTLIFKSVTYYLMSIPVLSILKSTTNTFIWMWFRWKIERPIPEELHSTVTEDTKTAIRSRITREGKRKLMRWHFRFHSGGYVWADSAMDAYNNPATGEIVDPSQDNHMGKKERLVEPLTDFLSSMVDLRGHLKNHKDLKIFHFLVSCLQDPDPYVVRSAARGIGLVSKYLDSTMRREVVLTFFDILNDAKSSEIASSASARGLKRVPHSSTLDETMRYFSHPEHKEAYWTSRSWVQAYILEAIEALIDDHDINASRYFRGYETLANLLMEKASDRQADLAVRVNAIKALGHLHDRPLKMFNTLKTILQTDPDPTVQETAAWSITRLYIADQLVRHSDRQIDKNEFLGLLVLFVQGQHARENQHLFRRNRVLESLAKRFLKKEMNSVTDAALLAQANKVLYPSHHWKKFLTAKHWRQLFVGGRVWFSKLFQLGHRPGRNPIVFVQVDWANGGNHDPYVLEKALNNLQGDLFNEGMTSLQTLAYYQKRSEAELRGHRTKGRLLIKLQTGFMSNILLRLSANQPARVQRRDKTRGSIPERFAYVAVPVSYQPIVVFGRRSERGALMKVLGWELPEVKLSPFASHAADNKSVAVDVAGLSKAIREAAEQPVRDLGLITNGDRVKIFALKCRETLDRIIAGRNNKPGDPLSGHHAALNLFLIGSAALLSSLGILNSSESILVGSVLLMGMMRSYQGIDGQEFNSVYSPADPMVRLKVSPDVLDKGLSRVGIARILGVARRSELNDTREDGRSVILKLPEADSPVVGDKRFLLQKIKGVTYKGDLPDFTRPYIPGPMDKMAQSTHIVKFINGKMIYEKAPPYPAGGLYLDDAANEYRMMKEAFEAGIPTGYPEGVGEYPEASFNGKKVGFVVMGVDEEESQRMGDVFRARWVDSDKASRPEAENILRDAYRQFGVSLGAAGKTLRQLHANIMIHGQPHVFNFSLLKENGEAALYDFTTAKSYKGMRFEAAREEFVFRSFNDFRSLYLTAYLEVTRDDVPETYTKFLKKLHLEDPLEKLVKHYFTHEDIKLLGDGHYWIGLQKILDATKVENFIGSHNAYWSYNKLQGKRPSEINWELMRIFEVIMGHQFDAQAQQPRSPPAQSPSLWPGGKILLLSMVGLLFLSSSDFPLFSVVLLLGAMLPHKGKPLVKIDRTELDELSAYSSSVELIHRRLSNELPSPELRAKLAESLTDLIHNAIDVIEDVYDPNNENTVDLDDISVEFHRTADLEYPLVVEVTNPGQIIDRDSLKRLLPYASSVLNRLYAPLASERFMQSDPDGLAIRHADLSATIRFVDELSNKAGELNDDEIKKLFLSRYFTTKIDNQLRYYFDGIVSNGGVGIGLWAVAQRIEGTGMVLEMDSHANRTTFQIKIPKKYLKVVSGDPLDDSIDRLTFKSRFWIQILKNLHAGLKNLGIPVEQHTIRALGRRTVNEVKGFMDIGKAYLAAIQQALKSYGIQLKPVSLVPPHRRQRPPPIEAESLNDEIAAYRFLYRYLTSLNVELIGNISRHSRQPSRQTKLDREQIFDDIHVLATDLLPYMKPLYVAVEGEKQTMAEDILSLLQGAEEMLKKNNGVAANMVLAAAIKVVNSGYTESFNKKVELIKANLAQDQKLIPPGPRQNYWLLLAGGFGLHSIGHGVVQLKVYSRKRFSHLWQVVRSLNHQVSRELQYLEEVNGMIKELDGLMGELSSVEWPDKNLVPYLSIPLRDRLGKLEMNGKSFWIVEKELAQQGFRVSREMLEVGDVASTLTVLNLTKSLLETRRMEIGAILKNLEQNLDRTIYLAKEERNFDLTKAIFRLQRAFSDHNEASFKWNLARFLGRFPEGKFPEPEFFGMRDLAVAVDRIFNEISVAYEAGNQGEVDRLYGRGQAFFHRMRNKIGISDDAYTFSRIYRRWFSTLRRNNVPPAEATELALHQAFEEFLRAQGHFPEREHSMWMRMFPFVFQRFIEKTPKNTIPKGEPMRALSSDFQALALLADLVALNKIPFILLDNLLTAPGRPIYEYLNTRRRHNVDSILNDPILAQGLIDAVLSEVSAVNTDENGVGLAAEEEPVQKMFSMWEQHKAWVAQLTANTPVLLVVVGVAAMMGLQNSDLWITGALMGAVIPWHRTRVRRTISVKKVTQGLFNIGKQVPTLNHELNLDGDNPDEELDPTDFTPLIISRYGEAVGHFNSLIANGPMTAERLEDEYLRFHAALGRDVVQFPGRYDELKDRQLVEDLFEKIFDPNYEEMQTDPIGVAAHVYCTLVNYQIFMDGNKRAASLIMNYVLLKTGHKPFILDEDNVVDYARLVNHVNKEERMRVNEKAFKRFLERQVGDDEDDEPRRNSKSKWMLGLLAVGAVLWSVGTGYAGDLSLMALLLGVVLFPAHRKHKSLDEAVRNTKDEFHISTSLAILLANNFRVRVQKWIGSKNGAPHQLDYNMYQDQDVVMPTGDEKGTTFTFSIGGTNGFVAEVELKGNGQFEKKSHIHLPLNPYFEDMGKLFDVFANQVAKQLAAQGDQQRHCTVAVLWAFPIEKKNGQAITTLLTKGWKETRERPVVGQDLIALFNAAFVRAGVPNVKVSIVVNDTYNPAAALAYIRKIFKNIVGAILGTGSNEAFWVPGFGFVNGETGDDDLGRLLHRVTTKEDLAMVNEEPKGRHLFEKRVAGKYIGNVFVKRLLIVSRQTGRFGFLKWMLGFPRRINVGHLSGIAADKTENLDDIESLFRKELAATPIIGKWLAWIYRKTPLTTVAERQAVKDIAHAVMLRSARLMATHYAGIVDLNDPAHEQEHTFAIEGSVFNKYPGYPEMVRKALNDIFGNDTSSRIHLVPMESIAKDLEGVGAAILGFTAAKAKFGITTGLLALGALLLANMSNTIPSGSAEAFGLSTVALLGMTFRSRKSRYPGDDRMKKHLKKHKGQLGPIAKKLGVSTVAVSQWLAHPGRAHIRVYALKQGFDSRRGRPSKFPEDKKLKKLFVKFNGKQVLVAKKLKLTEAAVSIHLSDPRHAKLKKFVVRLKEKLRGKVLIPAFFALGALLLSAAPATAADFAPLFAQGQPLPDIDWMAVVVVASLFISVILQFVPAFLRIKREHPQMDTLGIASDAIESIKGRFLFLFMGPFLLAAVHQTIDELFFNGAALGRNGFFWVFSASTLAVSFLMTFKNSWFLKAGLSVGLVGWMAGLAPDNSSTLLAAAVVGMMMPRELHKNNGVADSILRDIKARQGELSFDVANAVPQLQVSSPLLKDRFTRDFYKVFRKQVEAPKVTSEAVMQKAFETQADVGVVIHINSEADFPRLEETIRAVSQRNQRLKNFLAVAITLPANASTDLKEELKQRIRVIEKTTLVPIAVAQAGEPGFAGEQPSYAQLFSVLGTRFKGKAGQLFADLALNKVSGKRIVVVGVPSVPYRVSERFAEIMQVLVPLVDRSVLIDLRLVLEAAKQA